MSKITKFVRTSRLPMRFGSIHRGSLFRIHAEPSRGMKYSRDNTVYRLAQLHEGFYAYDIHNRDNACLLMPDDTVWPLRVDKG